MHAKSFADVVGKKPVALLFATPQLCQSRVCGPVVDVALQMKAKYGDRVEFIHQEVYADNDPNKGLREPLQRFNLPTEPWLFVVGRGRQDHRTAGGVLRARRLRRGAQDRTVITVFAHGLVQRSSLPIPEWLFGWAAAIVLCISFVALAALWPQAAARGPGLAAAARRVGACSAAAPVEIVGGVIGVAILALVLVTGYAGPPTPLDNFAPTFVFIIFWVGLVFASVLFGDVFRLFNPWRAIGRVLFRGRDAARLPGAARALARRDRPADLHVDRARLGLGRAARDARLRGGRLQRRSRSRRWRVYGVEPWARHGETFSVYFNLFSRMSVFETRDRVRRRAAVPRRAAAPGPGRRHGRAGRGDDRHRHLRRAEPGPALDATSPCSSTTG